MKKIIVLTVLLVMFTVLVFAQKPTTWTKLENIHAGIIFNHQVGDEYYPLAFYFDGTAVSEDNGKRGIREILPIGAPNNEPFKLKTFEEQKAFYQALPAFLKPILKDLRIQATSEDVSQ